MYRPGVWSREQLLRSPEHLFGLRIAVAYSLLNTSDETTGEDVHVFERATRAIKLSSGVYRTTYRSRFSDLDRVTGPLFRTVFSPATRIEVHDWAASAALPSLEWALRIFDDFPNASFIASDYFLFLIEARNSGDQIYVMEPDGTPIQYVRPPFVVPLASRERNVFISNCLAITMARRGAKKVRELSREIDWSGTLDPGTYEREGWAFRQLNLIHPHARQLAVNDPRFCIKKHDAFCSLGAPCDVLRVMNFYNPRVWGFEKACLGLKAAAASIREGGLLIVGRTIEECHPARNDVSIFQKSAIGLKVVQRLGSGFEMEDAVLTCSQL